jgi:septum formation inhibitor MinC
MTARTTPLGDIPAANELFATETMAELCARQGRTADAIGIYRRLLTERGADDRRAKWAARLAALEGGGAAGRPGGGPDGARGATAAPARARSPEPRPEAETSEVDDGMIVAEVTEVDVVPASGRRVPLLVEGPVRSGQVIYAEDRDLIVLAAVNPGAQLIADGHIHVYGPLRGRAVAGAQGWLGARIFCQRLEAELVGIDAAYLTSDDLPRDRFAKAAQISIRDGRCVVAAL